MREQQNERELIPEGYEEVPAGQFASEAQYRCDKCNRVFVAAHYSSVRRATGRTVTHCGEPAWWIRNLRRKEALKLLKKGDTMLIYEDPTTETKPEGKATLLTKTKTPDVELEDGSHLEFWVVIFPNGEEAYRKIKVK